jgi:hypothetical protein
MGMVRCKLPGPRPGIRLSILKQGRVMFPGGTVCPPSNQFDNDIAKEAVNNLPGDPSRSITTDFPESSDARDCRGCKEEVRSGGTCGASSEAL